MRKFHEGIHYAIYLKQIHQVRKPSSYLEIGVQTGATLAFAQCPAVGVDPQFQFSGDVIGGRAETYLFQMKSDEFFAQHNVTKFLPGGVDFAFLDGMHQFEFLLRDLLNTEKYSHKDTVVALHDCYPVNTEITSREESYDGRTDEGVPLWWTGDVWKLLPILREFRPDLDVVALDCPPTGLVIVRGLDPKSTALMQAYDEIIAKYLDVTLDSYGIDRFRAEFPTAESRRLLQPDALDRFLARRT